MALPMTSVDSGDSRLIASLNPSSVMHGTLSIASTGSNIDRSTDMKQWLIQFRMDILADQRAQFERFFSLLGSHAPSTTMGVYQVPEEEVVPAKRPSKKSSTLTAELLRFGPLDHWFKKDTPEARVSHRVSFPQTDEATTSREITHTNSQPASKGVTTASLASIASRSISSIGAKVQATSKSRKSFEHGAIQRHVMVQGQESKSFRERNDDEMKKLPESHFFGLLTDANFDLFCGIIILANAILAGVETEYLAQTGSAPKTIDNIQMVFSIWYLVELTMRVLAYRGEFIKGADRNWNLFDAVLAVVAVVDFCLTTADVDSEARTARSARMLRAIRLCRVIRTLRIFRTFRHAREFRKMAYSLVATLETLFWTMLLVFGVMYFFALWFTQVGAYVAEDISDGGNAILVKKSKAIREFYSSFSRTLYSLFGAISGAYSWHVLLDCWIGTDSDLTVALFFVFIVLAVFGLMNIVTSIFVESAMYGTKHFQDLLMDNRKKDLEMYNYHLEKIFREIDRDNGGTLSFEEMANFLNDEESELPGYLEALGISSDDVWVLFKLLDKNDLGVISLQDFCEGCLRLKGEARSFDINCLIYESRAMSKAHTEFMEFVEDRLNHLEKQSGRQARELGKFVYSQEKYPGITANMLPSTPRSVHTPPPPLEPRVPATGPYSPSSLPSNRSPTEDGSDNYTPRGTRRGASQQKTILLVSPRQPDIIEEEPRLSESFCR